MGEPTIYKPSIYKGNGVYNNGATAGQIDEIFTEQIKDNKYQYKKIGNKYYTLNNLREVFTGVGPFNSSTPSAPHYVNFNNQIFGYYYSMGAVSIIDTWIRNNTNWRVATKEDLDEIVSNFDYKDIFDIGTWKTNTLDLQNNTKFSLLASGYSNSGSVNNVGNNGYLITSTSDNGKNYYLISYQTSGTMSVENTYSVLTNAWPIRLVKDA